ncbi:MAG: transglutaminase domain-containing protein [Planctomycetota bacterium]
MMKERWQSLLFVASQATWYALVPGNFAAVATFAALTLLAVFLPPSLYLRSRTHLLMVLLLAAVFGLAGVQGIMNGSELIELLRLFGSFLLLVQSLELLRVRREEQVNYLPGLGCISFSLLLLSSYPDERPSAFEFAPLIQIVGTLLVLRPDLPKMLLQRERGKGMTLLAVFAICLVVGKLFQEEVRRDLPQLRQKIGVFQVDEQVRRVLARSDARFVQSVELDSVSLANRANPDQVVFTVEASQVPGYLRTLSFSSFDGRKWRSRSRQKLYVLSPTSQRELQLAGPVSFASDLQQFPGRLYQLHERGTATNKMIVEVSEGHGGLVPAPIDAFAVKGATTRPTQLHLDEHGNIVERSLVNRRYMILTGKIDQPRARAKQEGLLDVPVADAEFLTSLANDLCGGSRADASSTLKRDVLSIARFFRENFEYSLEMVDISSNRGSRSRLRYFVENRLAAHCEFFATATVMLLRARGHESRLTTGYLVYERNDETDDFEAKNRGAHAWAEVFNPQSQRWEIIESTPGFAELMDSVLDESEDAIGRRGIAVAEDSWFSWQTIVDALTRIQSIIAESLRSRFAWVLPIPVALLVGLVLRRRGIWLAKRQPLSGAVRKADRRAKRLGVRRETHETCHQFARRLRQIDRPGASSLAAWYESHALHWYASGSPTQMASNAESGDEMRLARSR